MKWSSYVRSFLFPRLLEKGAQTPIISLTAHDGTWIQSGDYLNEKRILWLSCKDVNDEATQRWVRTYARSIDALEQNNCLFFLISSQGLEEIRTLHRSVDLDTFALYDPMAIEARKLGLSGRRPMCRDAVLLIDEQGRVINSQCGQSDVEQWLAELGVKTETPVESDSSITPILPINATETEQLMEQGGVLVDVRTFSEYEPDHVPNSLHIPVDELPSRVEEIGQNSRIIFICQAGGRAYSAAEFMTSIGATDVYVVNGGMSSWTGIRNTDGKVS